MQVSSPDKIIAASQALRLRFGDRLQTGLPIRQQHASTLTWLPSAAPDAVVFAQSLEDVIAVVRECAAHKVPIIPFGAGTSLEGHVNAPFGGISLDLSRMTRIIAVNDADLDAEVEAGVTRNMLNEHLCDRGLFFPIDPGAGHATLGGMASTRASGTTAVRYGTMKDNVLNVTAVMADGSVVRSARRARKSSAGYDLTRLMVGAEGTLGVITSLTVRLFGQPETVLAAVCPFKTIEGACNTVIESIQLGLGAARMELVDEVQIRAFASYSKLPFKDAPTLFVEFHGSPAVTADQLATFRGIAEREGMLSFEQAEKLEDRNRLWKARHDGFWAVKALRPGAESLATDVCVPISRFAECVTQTKADITRLGLLAPLVGHAGDGNFHLQPLVDLKDAREMANVAELLERLTARALEMDGTCTGEHGIGTGKIKYMAAEHGEGLQVMRAIKRALDPNCIMNPGKIFPV